MPLQSRKTSSHTNFPLQVREDGFGCIVAIALDDQGKRVQDYGDPAMKICPEGEGGFSVDYNAGVQRARFGYVTKKELCFRHKEEFRGYGPYAGPRKMVDGYLTWIGLSCRDPEVKDWLQRHGAGKAEPGIKWRRQK